MILSNSINSVGSAEFSHSTICHSALTDRNNIFDLFVLNVDRVS